MPFLRLRLREPILRALQEEGYAAPTPIQAQAIPPRPRGARRPRARADGHREDGRVRRCRSSSGSRGRRRRRRGAAPRLVLAPTRELAAQVGESFRRLRPPPPAPARRRVRRRRPGAAGRRARARRRRPRRDAGPAARPHAAGARRPSTRRGARPRRGRPDARHGLPPRRAADPRALPPKRQTLFFSATMPRDARRSPTRILVDPVRVAVAPAATTVETVDQSVYFVDKADKPRLLEHLLSRRRRSRARSSSRARSTAPTGRARPSCAAGIDADAIHGNKSPAPARAVARAASGAASTRVLVATDIAARGIDVDEDHPRRQLRPAERAGDLRPPHRAHRPRGRDAAIAISFCDPAEEPFLRDIERTIRVRLGVVEDHPFPARAAAAAAGLTPAARPLHGNSPQRRPQQGKSFHNRRRR